ncbi:transposase [Solwaraspora sp. WMMD406]|uniref:RNA-guided endonuclease InsQ/TnpB family protein n=1 Tax=Solwaraspora sp. WMMD406 TaxID=3016095 RepID=UPI0024169BB2|nr:transposase [Solwaraspora sp. WMMD406]MDG4763868.1 transposase [Solwaraspora sp. WMMD406]
MVFNDGLRARQTAREQGLPYVSDAELSKRAITRAKATPERAWLGEVSVVMLQQALADLNTQQALSRTQRGSNRREKAVVKVARAHARVADTRRDWQHKLSTTIIRENQAVYVEDLCVVGLGRTRLAASVHDAGWSSYVAMVEYKAARYGRTFARVDRWLPSTRMCSDCGRVNGRMALNVRSWVCPCGGLHDRDVNAAINIKAAGQADFNDRGARVGPGPVPAPRGETVTHQNTSA